MRTAHPPGRPRPSGGRSDRFADARPRPARASRSWAALAAVVLAIGSGLASAGMSVPQVANVLTGNGSAPVSAAGDNRRAWSRPTVKASARPRATTLPVATSPTTAPNRPVLRVPGAVPPAGRGTFGFDRTYGAVLGRSGTLRRYRVAVESGADEHIEAFAGAVDLALGDQRSWIGSGRLRLQRVPAQADHDFTIYLATARTAARMCAAGGVNVRVNGRPYTSCRTPGRVIINLDRWRLSVDHIVAARVPLLTYRTYVVNHEVGHELGHGHERCPGEGRPAPVMMQQTLYLDGCVANPWPYLGSARYFGPAL